ncbi:hypothetical protein [Sinobaca sp. H24]|uniref:hypothetical protein n=1 Tax=Sinobaca sp. H24 TaxID=2923376 RepID=UPI00207952AD|nr:hypothetical protein [Sinobaca sp. H24]
MKRRIKPAVVYMVIFAAVGFLIGFVVSGAIDWMLVLNMSITGAVCGFFVTPDLHLASGTKQERRTFNRRVLHLLLVVTTVFFLLGLAAVLQAGEPNWFLTGVTTVPLLVVLLLYTRHKRRYKKP